MIVLGLGYGDEGKGLTTSFLCEQQKNPIVVRFNGGHQAGHTVVFDGKRHIFSNFGSGTLQGVPTYWSQYCTFYPYAFLNEYALLDAPDIYVNPRCPVTTPFDILFNQQLEKIHAHGSVGAGFGTTLRRQEANYKLHVQDLYYPIVLEQKLKAIAKYYDSKDADDQISLFMEDAKEVTKRIILSDSSFIFRHYNPIFEGAQGILLDQDFGFFPNVTRSNTTAKNAVRLYKHKEEVYYVTRTYLTRHGNGFLPGEEQLELINNESETNVAHEYQGKFRTAELNMELMNYALRCDDNFSFGLEKNLVITCFDQYPIDIPELLYKLPKFSKVFVSSGPSLNDIVELKQ